MEAQQQPPRPLPQGEHQRGSMSGQLSCAQCRSRKLKCDRKRPRCDRCVEKSETCTYPETRQRGLGRRRTVKDLEERIEELEGLLRAADLGAAAHGAEQDPSFLGMDPLPSSLAPADPAFAEPPLMDADPSAGQLVNLGLLEQFPRFELVDELTSLFFQNIHIGAPMLHQAAYSAALRLPPHMRPPMCLQYIVMASAAATSPAYRHLSEPFYQRARVYAEADELQAQGEVFTTVAHVQSWCLISAYECHVYAVFTRASTSLCRAVRIAQMLKLHQLDNPADPGFGLPPPRNNIEAEERRRTWWVVFLADRYLTSTTGWPSLIDERHVGTLLPSTEEAFAVGAENPYPTPLSEGLHRLEHGLGDHLAPFTIRILAANELLHALDHSAQGSNQTSRDNTLHDLDSPYWRRRREIDSNLATLTHLLPAHLNPSQNPRSLDAILVHICTSMAVLQLHRPLTQISRSSARLRLLPAAETVLSVLRAAANANSLSTAIRNPLVPFSTYMAASVFLADCTLSLPAGQPDQHSEESLEYLANILVSFSARTPLVKANLLQLAADLQKVGRGWLMERILTTGDGAGMEGVQILSRGSGGTMSFCPALTSVRGGTGGQEPGARFSALGGAQGLGRSGLTGGYDGSVFAGPSDMGLLGAAGPSILQADSTDGLFSRLSATGLEAFIP